MRETQSKIEEQTMDESLAILCPFNPTALRTAKTLWSFGCSECRRVKHSVFQSYQDDKRVIMKDCVSGTLLMVERNSASSRDQTSMDLIAYINPLSNTSVSNRRTEGYMKCSI